MDVNNDLSKIVSINTVKPIQDVFFIILLDREELKNDIKLKIM